MEITQRYEQHNIGHGMITETNLLISPLVLRVVSLGSNTNNLSDAVGFLRGRWQCRFTSLRSHLTIFCSLVLCSFAQFSSLSTCIVPDYSLQLLHVYFMSLLGRCMV